MDIVTETYSHFSPMSILAYLKSSGVVILIFLYDRAFYEGPIVCPQKYIFPEGLRRLHIYQRLPLERRGYEVAFLYLFDSRLYRYASYGRPEDPGRIEHRGYHLIIEIGRAH